MHSKESDNNFNIAVSNLFHGKVLERATAARELGHFKEAKATNILARALNSEKDPIVINRIIEAMGEIGDPKATILIIDFLKKEIEKTEDLRDKTRLFIIIESLMKIGDKRALQDLGILLDSCDNEIKKLTEQALECIDPDWIENLKRI
jgi:HEAT repeat protein